MDEPLAGGNTTVGVVRVGETVRRPRSHRSGFAAEVLIRLHELGFRWAPVYLGIDDDGRDTFSYVSGATTDHPVQRDERCYPAVGAILRELHELTKDVSAAGAAVCLVHGDPGPFNMVMVEGMPIALIDWDSVHVGEPMEDVGYAGWTWCIQTTGNVQIADQARRLRAFADGYDPDLGFERLLDAIYASQDAVMRVEAANALDERFTDERRRHARAAVDWADSCRELLHENLDLFVEALRRGRA